MMMMLAAQVAALSLSFCSSDTSWLSDKVDRSVSKVVAAAVENFLNVRVRSSHDIDEEDEADDESRDESDSELVTVPPDAEKDELNLQVQGLDVKLKGLHLGAPQAPAAPAAPAAPRAPLPPRAPLAPGKRITLFRSGSEGDLPEPQLEPFTEHAKNATTVDLLHRIARTAGWSMTLVGSPTEKVDIDVERVDPREALRLVLKASGSMAVLKRDRLVVVASPEGSNAGMLVQETSAGRKEKRSSRKDSGHDLMHLFQGDITVPQGAVVQGDVLCVGGSIEVEPGAVVQGDAISILGSTNVDEGALILGDAVALFGSVNVDRGAQVMGEHLQLGIGRILGGDHRPHGARSKFRLTQLGPFGLFPTVALFAVIYLLGLLALRVWPDRVRSVGATLFESPARSFFIGFLCWLLLLPLVLLLLVSLVGIPLVPLLPVVVFLSIVLGISSLALRIGESLPAGPGQRFVPPAALGMGIAVLLLLAFVPWLGIAALALLQIFALGAAVGSRFGRALPPHLG